MNILILGGTVFLGRHLVQRAMAQGHVVTLLNRGQQNAALFPSLEKLRGDRDGDLSALAGRQFDAVIDTCGYQSAQMHAIVAALGAEVRYYLFISTISAYGKFPPGRAYDESTPLTLGDSGYGASKARCEEVIDAAWPGRVALVRPGLIVGPHDPTGRFTYWPQRAARGGAMLAPGRPDSPVQWIDVRDLANWCIHLCEQRITGQFNAVGPAEPTSFAQLLARCQAVTHSDARPVWIDDAALLAHGVAPWTELPLWIPREDPDAGGMLRADNRRALAAGLTLRPLDATIADTLAWGRAEPLPRTDNPRRAKTMTPEREAELLASLL